MCGRREAKGKEGGRERGRGGDEERRRTRGRLIISTLALPTGV